MNNAHSPPPKPCVDYTGDQRRINELKIKGKNQTKCIEELFKKYYRPLLERVARNFSKFDHYVCDDVASWTLDRVHKKAYQFKGTKDLSAYTWIIRICDRRALDVERDREKHQNDVSLDGLEDYKQPTSGEFENKSMASDEINTILRFGHLTNRELEVFLLLLDDKSRFEISKILKISIPRISQIIKSFKSKRKRFLE
ncbi:MAG: hypothetical protein MUO72_13455 [Bacteroidales bacterium]|nr:hypothetical protein [Bacteroidales bacterium]